MNFFDSLIIIYHAFNRFLSHADGELLKKSVELLFLVFVIYMITSEYRKDKRKDLKYLRISFIFLAIEKIVMSFSLALVVFADWPFVVIAKSLGVIDPTIELFGLVFLVNAFIYTRFKSEKLFKSRIKNEIITLTIFFIILEIVWAIWGMYNPRYALPILGTLELMKILLLAYPIYVLLVNKKFDKYNKAIIIAFAVYLITPLLNVINILIRSGGSSYLKILAHPFPFFAIALFTRVVYLKLVDKANLRSKLAKTEKKYLAEKEVCKMKDEFVSVVSHELRTPITSIKLYLSLLKNGKFGDVNAKQINAIELVNSEGDRLINLINDILTMSKIENKKLVLKKSNHNLYQLVENNMLMRLAKEKNISVINQVPENFTAKVDEERFNQIFINLFSNAVKHTSPGGVIKIHAKKNTKNWYFSVIDNGEGIEKSKIPKLFDKFYQAQNYLTRKQGGTGLGLAIVKNIAELHDGKIKVESELGKGSNFTIIMPH